MSWAQRLVKGGASAIAEFRFRIDSWANALTGLNTSRDKTTSTLPYFSPLLTQQLLENLYHDDDIANRIVTALPDEGFRERWSIIRREPEPEEEETTQERANELEADTERLGAREKLREAAVWGRLFGLGAVLVGYDDGRPPWEPVDWGRLRGVNYLTVLDKRDLTPWRWYADPQAPRFGDVAIYLMQPVGVFVGAPYDLGSTNQIMLVHEERMLRFGGELTSKRRRLANQGSDYSVLQRCFRALQLTNDNWQSAASLLADASQGVLTIKGLIDMISQQPEVMTQRFQFMDLTRSVSRAIVLDSDGEKFERVPSRFEGIPQMLEQTWKRLAAAARMPLTVLMGMSPGGLNATGESDIRWWYDQVKSFQEQDVRPAIELLLRAMAISKGWDDAEHWSISFAPLRQMSLLEESQVRLNIANADASNIDRGVYSPEEAALSHYGAGKFNVEVQVDAEARRRILELSAERAEVEAENELAQAKQPPEQQGQQQPRSLGPRPEVVTAKSEDPESTPDPKPPGVVTDRAGGARPFDRRDADWNEEDHPRDEGGKFSTSGGSPKTQAMREKLEKMRARTAEMTQQLKETQTRIAKEHEAHLKEAVANHPEVLAAKAHVAGLEHEIAKTEGATKEVERALKGEDHAADKHGVGSPEHQAAQLRTAEAAARAGATTPTERTSTNARPEVTEEHRAKAETAAKESEKIAEAHPVAIPTGATPEQIKAAEDFIAPHQEHLVDNLAQLNSVATKDAVITGRAKTVGSALEKTVRKPDEYPHVSKLQDMTGMRVMAKDIASVKENVANIKANYKVIGEENAIDTPKGDYRSYHMTVETAHGQVAEIQIRTPGQHEFAEWAHNVYKPSSDEQRTALKDPRVKAEVASYSKAVSQHIYDRDLGRKVGAAPRPSPTVKAVFGRVKT